MRGATRNPPPKTEPAKFREDRGLARWRFGSVPTPPSHTVRDAFRRTAFPWIVGRSAAFHFATRVGDWPERSTRLLDVHLGRCLTVHPARSPLLLIGGYARPFRPLHPMDDGVDRECGMPPRPSSGAPGASRPSACGGQRRVRPRQPLAHPRYLCATSTGRREPHTSDRTKAATKKMIAVSMEVRSPARNSLASTGVR